MSQNISEPIAIIGIGCRFPGGIDNPETFWQLLHDGRSAITEVPADRWDIAAYYDPDPDAPGKMYTRHGGFLDQIDTFDPQFFRISPREAVSLDPQQRLLLEVGWETLEQGNQSSEQFFGSSTGVFIGISSFDYILYQSGYRESLAETNPYFGAGSAWSVAAGRLSYTFGWTGPSVAVDTACSSSLVAVHLACQSLQRHESEAALAGGVNLILTPASTINFCNARMLAPDGQCKTFDASADGYVRSEGCGLIFLKRLSDAIAAGDTILAVIRGSGMNQDGPSSSLTVPNGVSQQGLIRQVLREARLEPEQVSYIEAHGTGTPVGDPIELDALGKVFKHSHSKDQPLIVGSVKTNIGHLEPASGIAGLIKVVLAFQHQEIPSHLNFKQPNPYIPWDEFSITVPNEPQVWPLGAKQRIAGVNSFGFGGTNAHIILEETPHDGRFSSNGTHHPSPITRQSTERPLHLLTLSAKSENALKALAARYKDYLTAHQDVALGDMCYTANTKRSNFSHRLSVTVSQTEPLAETLAAFSAGQETLEILQGQVQENSPPPRIAFLFSGQGAQYIGMGRELYETQPTFRQTLEQCDEILRSHLEQSLLSVLYPPSGISSPLDETVYTQPAIFSLEYALAKLWQSWGVEPSIVVGHSLGEYAAACIAGVFSLEDALKLIAERGRLMQALPQDGDMAAILADEARIASAIQPYSNEISIAAINAPKSIVISGKRQALQAVLDTLEAEEIKTKKLRVSHAFHSPLMEPMLKDFERLTREVNYSSPKIDFICYVTGELATAEVVSSEYWCRHIRQPVRFLASMQTLQQQGYDVFLEVGPKPTLLGLGRQCLEEPEMLWLPSLRQGRPDWQQMLQSLGELYVRGVSIDWTGFDRHYNRSLITLPTYPFQRKRYWLEVAEVPRLRRSVLQTSGKGSHPLLGQRLLSALKTIQFESHLSQQMPTFLKDHHVFDMAILPATGFLEMAVAAGVAEFESQALILKDIVIQQALILPEDQERTMQTILTPDGSGGYTFQIFSLSSLEESQEPSWILHVSGKLRMADAASQPPKPLELDVIQSQNPEEKSVEEFYQEFAKWDIDYGQSFRAVEQIRQNGHQTLAKIRLPETLTSEAPNYILHPVLLDNCLQAVGSTLSEEERQSSYFPIYFEHIQVYRPLSKHLWTSIQRHPASGQQPHTLTADLDIFDETGMMMAEIKGFSFRRASREVLLHELFQKGFDDWLYEIDWQSKPPPQGEPSQIEESGSWIIFSDHGGLGGKLAQALRERGNPSILVSPGQIYAMEGEGHYRINPSSPKDFQRLFQESSQDTQAPYRGIIHLWSLDDLKTDDLQSSIFNGCGSVLHLIQALSQTVWPQYPKLCLVTRGTQPIGIQATPLQLQQVPLWGLGKVIALEHPELSCVRLDLDPVEDSNAVRWVLEALQATDNEDQVAYRQGNRYVARLVRHTSKAGESQISTNTPVQVKMSDYGILENLTLEPMTRKSPGPGEVEIQVMATGLNFRDVLHALGMLKEFAERLGIQSAADMPFGFECVGKIAAIGEGISDFQIGDDVIAAFAIGSLSSFVTVRVEGVVLKPQHLSFEEAATLPITFLTAYYGLYELAKIQPGDKVLIHAAAGGVGQAAVQLVQQTGAEVFATASPGKWEFLRSIGVEHIMNSRTLDFAEEIMTTTHGEGVDIVLNSLSGKFIDKSFEVLKENGRFIEIGKIGIWDEQQVKEFRPQASYFPFDLGEIAQQQPTLMTAMLKEFVKWLQDGILKPLPFRVFPLQEVAEAFRFMAQAKHIGKVVISNQLSGDSKQVSEGSAQKPKKLMTEHSSLITDKGSYLISGGLGALGLKVAYWLAEQGAKHVILTGRSGASDTAKEAIQQMEQTGAQVQIIQADVSRREDVATLLEDISTSLPPLRGIVHAAGVLDDGVLLQQTWERFRRVMAPKVEGAWNLHLLTRDIPLDFFVCFSSIAALLGSPGQGNYAAANVFMDALAHHRRTLGVPGLSINWGPWADTGMAARLDSKDQNRWAAQGMSFIAPELGLQVLEELMKQDMAQVGVCPINWPRFLRSFPVDSSPPLFSDIARRMKDEQPTAKRLELLHQLQEASIEERHSLIMAYIQAGVAKALGFSISELDVHQPLNNMGLDSLMAIELRNRMMAELGVDIPMEKFIEGPSIAQMTDLLIEQLALANIILAEPASAEPSEDMEEITI